MGLSGGLVVLRDVQAIGAAELRVLSMAGAVERTSKRWRASGIRIAYGDQRESLSLQSLFSQNGITYTPIPWTSASKPRAVEIVRRWLTDDQIALPNHLVLKREMLAFQEKILPSGQLSFTGRRGGHDDHVALLLTGALAAEQGALHIEARAKRREARDLQLAGQMHVAGYPSGLSDSVASKLAVGLSWDDAHMSGTMRAAMARQEWIDSGGKARDDAAWDRLCGRKGEP